MIEWDEARIRGVLPHRGRMLLVRAASLADDTPRGRATIEIPAGSWVAELCCPHLYVVEALAQLAGLALAAARREAGAGPALGVLAEIPDVRLGAEPRAGDEVRLEADLGISFWPLTRFEVAARRREEDVVSGTLTVAVAG